MCCAHCTTWLADTSTHEMRFQFWPMPVIHASIIYSIHCACVVGVVVFWSKQSKARNKNTQISDNRFFFCRNFVVLANNEYDKIAPEKWKNDIPKSNKCWKGLKTKIHCIIHNKRFPSISRHLFFSLFLPLNSSSFLQNLCFIIRKQRHMLRNYSNCYRSNGEIYTRIYNEKKQAKKLKTRQNRKGTIYETLEYVMEKNIYSI